MKSASPFRTGIDELFAKAATVSGVVGMQLSLIKDDEQVDFVHGFANAERELPMTQDTVVQIGSTTKIFNAMMIMSLVEEGKLELDVPVKGYLPQFAVSDPQASRTITLRQLLSMSAGIDNGDYADHGAGPDAIARRVASLKDLPQHFPPGTHFGYSNAGSDICGHVAERVTGRIWDELIKERVLDPAELKNAVSLDDDRMFQQVSVGHRVDPKSGKIEVIRPWHGLSRGTAPAGSTLTVSAHDLARFGKLFLNKGIGDSGTRVVSEKSIEAMMVPQIDVPVHHMATGWCLGPFAGQWNGAGVWGHHGGNTSGMSLLYWVPSRNGVLACTFNTPSLPAYERLIKIMTQDIMEAAFGVARPGIEPPQVPVDIEPARYVGSYEAMAGECHIEADGADLSMTMTWGLAATHYTEKCPLIPLGNDRFMIDRGPDSDPLVLPEDMAFFGDDGRRRATNMTRVAFPYSRKGC
jgi:CubicO group peptidase (beta-lactamase class C family)